MVAAEKYFQFNANDRLLNTLFLDADDSTQDRYTVYAYGSGNVQSRLTAKSVYRGRSTASRETYDTFTYECDGCLQTSKQYRYNTSGSAIWYQYLLEHCNANGLRMTTTWSTSTDGDSTYEQQTQRRLVYDVQSQTGIVVHQLFHPKKMRRQTPKPMKIDTHFQRTKQPKI